MSRSRLLRSWRLARLALALLFLGRHASAQDLHIEGSLPDDQARDRLLTTQSRAMTGLALWSGASVTTGALLLSLGRTPFVRAFGAQQLAWGAIDGAITAFSFRGMSRDRDRHEPRTHWQHEREKLRTVLAINVALDVVYVAVGAGLLRLGRRDTVRGSGAGILPQGAFLLVFDSAFWLSL